MDKRDWVDYLLMISKIYLIIVIVVAIPFNIIVSFLSSLSGIDFASNFVTNVSTMLVSLVFLGIVMYLIFALIIIFSKLRRKKDMIVEEKYVRDIPENLSPAIASILLDCSIEITTDYTATITNLMVMDYIDINYDTEEIILKKDNLEKLLKHEKYVLECLLNKEKCDFEKFKELLVSDAKDGGLIKEEKRKIHFFRNLIFSIVLFCILGILKDMYGDVNIITILLEISQLIAGVSIFGVIGYSIYNLSKYSSENFNRTEKGAKLAKECRGIKRYIHDFSLLSHKNISDVILWDKYIPYAISLNEANAIEKYIYSNDKYRRIIYGKINEFMK